jgi:hypothetical protein
MKSDVQKNSEIQRSLRLASLFRYAPEKGAEELKNEIAAAEAAGDMERVVSLKNIEATIPISPTAPITATLFSLVNLVPNEQFNTIAEQLGLAPQKAPDAFRTLQLRAEQAGLQPGTPEYQAFMRESGGGQTINFGLPGMGGVELGPTPPGTYTERDPVTGQLRNVPIPGSPGATEARGAAQSKTSLENTFESMFLGYKDLQTAGAIRDVEKSAGANIAAYLQTSPLGREIGKATGAPAEATREAIEALQPSISQAIMAQPGMSAKGMDSEKELQFFIKSITAPTTDVNTNYATLHALDMRFGSGQLLKKMLAQNVITQQEYNKITRSTRVSSVLGQLDDKVDELFTMETPATTAPAVPSRLQKYFGGE